MIYMQQQEEEEDGVFRLHHRRQFHHHLLYYFVFSKYFTIHNLNSHFKLKINFWFVFLFETPALQITMTREYLLLFAVACFLKFKHVAANINYGNPGNLNFNRTDFCSVSSSLMQGTVSLRSALNGLTGISNRCTTEFRWFDVTSLPLCNSNYGNRHKHRPFFAHNWSSYSIADRRTTFFNSKYDCQ